MAECTTPAQCSDTEYDMACAAGLLVVTVGEELAIHKFAEAVRAQAVASCKAVLDEAEEQRADQASRDARGTDEELSRLQHWATVSTYNAGVRRCIAAILAA